jgi:hypothetical protein
MRAPGGDRAIADLLHRKDKRIHVDLGHADAPACVKRAGQID